MNIVDSSGWLEYFANGPNAKVFSGPLNDADNLLVPTVCLYEVFKRMALMHDQEAAVEATVVMEQAQVISLTKPIARHAAVLSIEHGLPMADSMILATARAHRAELWTQDADFDGIEGVHFVPHAGS